MTRIIDDQLKIDGILAKLSIRSKDVQYKDEPNAIKEDTL
jgi:hypothetical protein